MVGPQRSGPKTPLGCHDRALGLLAVRPRSRSELRVRLLRAGFDPDEVEGELARLEAVGLVDDDAFARALADHHLNVRGSGRRAVVGALAARGVDRSTIEATLAGSGEDEGARAERLAVDRARRLASLPPEVAFERLVSFLGRRGYPADLSRGAARKALELDVRDG